MEMVKVAAPNWSGERQKRRSPEGETKGSPSGEKSPGEPEVRFTRKVRRWPCLGFRVEGLGFGV